MKKDEEKNAYYNLASNLFHKSVHKEPYKKSKYYLETRKGFVLANNEKWSIRNFSNLLMFVPCHYACTVVQI